MRNLRARCLASAACFALLAAPGLALAQVGVEEIVVTARKSEERLQEVPLAITAFTSETLNRAGANTLKDIAFLTPGLTVGGATTEVYRPVIRGLSNTGDTGAESNTSTFLDGIYIANPAAVSLGLMDLERVEVVKGPQSALYGHNAFSGAINYVTRKPTDEFGGDLELTGGQYDRYKIQGAVSGPLIPGKLRARLAANYDHFDGTWKDQVNGLPIGGFEKKDVQLSLQFQPSEAVTIDGTVYYGRDKFGLVAIVPLPNNCAPAGGLPQQFCGKVPDGHDLTAGPARPANPPSNASPNDRKVLLSYLRTNIDLGGASLDLLAGYTDVTAKTYNEFNARREGITYNLLPGPGTVTLNTFFGSQYNESDASLEARLSSTGDRRLRWKTGLFYFYSDYQVLVDVGGDKNKVPAGKTVQSPLLNLWLTPGGVPSANNTYTKAFNRSYSAFGSLDYDLTETLTATAEVRYTIERKHQNILRTASAPGTDPDGPLGFYKTWKFWNPRFTLNYKPSDTATLYASVAKGSKAGGFNQRATVEADIGYDPENNWTYEVGSKNTLMDGRLIANLAAFYIDWTGIQVSAPSANASSPGFVTKNFGSVAVYGGELELQAALGKGIEWTGGIAYTHPRLQDDAFDFAGAASCAVIPSCAARVTTFQGRPAVRLEGLQRPGASEWLISTSLDINRSLSPDWNWFGRVDYRYESKRQVNVDNFLYIGGRHNVNLRTGLEHKDYRLTFWIENLTNDLTPVSSGGNLRLTDLVFENIVNYADKRKFGVTLNAKF